MLTYLFIFWCLKIKEEATKHFFFEGELKGEVTYLFSYGRGG
jgi:hypothetical protein